MDETTFPQLSGLLSGQTVFVSGAGAGIGRAIALEAAHQGASVLFADINAARCEKVEAELLALGANAKGFVADLSRQVEIERLHAQLQEHGSVVDTLINNVGVEKESAPADWWQSWQRIYDTNVLGPGYLTKLITDAMIEKGVSGSVLFLLSIHQWQVRGDAAYSSSKAALGMIVCELAMELAPHGIRVNGIAPGFVKEDASGAPIPHAPTPLHRTSVLPAYIGRAAVYLCAEHFSKHTTGSILTLDGGLSLNNHLTMNNSARSTPGTGGATPSPLHALARKIRRVI